MKIRMYVCTYKNPAILNNWFLKSLSESNYPKDLVDIFIIDNASKTQFCAAIENQYSTLYSLMPNDLSPHFSTGHLARTWNYSIINGFEDLDKPQCDAVITVQHDTILTPNWYESVVKTLKTYDFITNGVGDQFLIFTPNAIKNIGLFDERLCNIGNQEADYFLRAVKFYPEKSSINDPVHGRLYNYIDAWKFIKKTKSGYSRRDPHHLISHRFHPLSLAFLKHKWHANLNLKHPHWVEASRDARQLCNNYITYPYFENKLNQDTLRNQLYVVPDIYLME